MQVSIEVEGVRQSLRTLGKIDPNLRKASVATMKTAAQPLVQVAKLQYPIQPPLSGMGNKGRLQYQPGRVRQQVIYSVGGRPAKGANAWPIGTLKQNNAAAQLYSVAGMRGNTYSRATNAGQENFSRALQERYGEGQRGMWKQVRLIRILAERNVLTAVKQVEIIANRELAR